MDDEYLRDCFAMFAMQKITWRKGEEKTDAEDCYVVADAMMEARVKKEEQGIAVIRGKRNVRKN